MSTRQLIIVGGPNGAGKTTFALEDLARRGGVYLGADAIAAELSPGDPAAAAIEAARLFIERFDQLVQTEQRLIVESTLAGKSLARMISTAASLGFQVEMNFMFIDSADLSLNRVRQRVLNGGHDVPETDIRRRFARTLANFWTIYRLLADDWFVFYNGGDGAVNIASGSGDSLTVYREAEFARFQQLIKRHQS